jgi:hypothetical protein
MKWRVVLYCLLGGLPLTISALGVGHFAWWWLSGILIAGAFVPVALFGPGKGLGQFAVIAPALFVVTVLCLWSEAVIFVPDSRFSQRAGSILVSSIVMYAILAAVFATLAQLLKLAKPVELPIPHRSIPGAAFLVVLSGLSYALYYLVFGGITYQFFTKGYYPHAVESVARLGVWFWPIEIARGILMALAALPIIQTLRMKRWQTAIAVGLLIWIIGGLAPLVVPNELMGLRQRIIHTVEIFTQNFTFGVTAALLLRPRSAAMEIHHPASVAGHV